MQRAFPAVSVKCLLLGREERRVAGEGQSSFRGACLLGWGAGFCFVAMGIKVLQTVHAETHLFQPPQLPKVRLANANAACGQLAPIRMRPACACFALFCCFRGCFLFLEWYILGVFFACLYVFCIHILSKIFNVCIFESLKKRLCMHLVIQVKNIFQKPKFIDKLGRRRVGREEQSEKMGIYHVFFHKKDEL